MFVLGVWYPCAAAILGCSGGDNLVVVPLDQTVSQGRRVTVSGVERWAYVLGETSELRFGGRPFRQCDLVWTCATLGRNRPAKPTLSVAWEDDEGTGKEPLLLWPSESDSSVGWSEIRVPLKAAHAGDAVFRFLSGADGADSVAIVAPRLEGRGRAGGRPRNRHNVVLIVMDTFRYDHVSRYGSTIARTPNIDAFLASSLEFTDAYTRTTFTLPSHVSMLTGLPPRSHGIRKNGQILDGSVTTAAQLAYAAGYRTAAFFEIATLREPSGFSAGFDSYTFCLKHRDPILVHAGAWLQCVGPEPFFLLANLAAVHLPRHPPHGVWQLFCDVSSGQEYRFRADERMEDLNVLVPPGTTRVRFAARQRTRQPYETIREPLRLGLRNWLVDAPEEMRLGWSTPVEPPPGTPASSWDWRKDGLVFTGEATLCVENSTSDTVVVKLSFEASMPRDVPCPHDRTQYALATSTLDSVVGELIGVIDRFCERRRTAVIVTSDHGEGLENHYERFHGHEVYEEAAHVVLGVHCPECRPRSISGLVSLDALAPTILDLMAVNAPPWMGQRVLTIPTRRTATSLVSESFDIRYATDPEPVPDDQAVRTEQWSLVLDSDRGSTRLYDRQRDLAEMENLAHSHPAIVDSLGRLLGETTRSQTKVYMPGATSDDPELLKALRALGYVD